MAAIEGDGGALTSAAARVVVQRRAAGGAGLLLAYLPHAENDNVLHDLQDALRTLAHDDKGTADPAVVRALEDEHPLRRATAVVLLSEGGLKQHREALRRLLVDPAPSVRLRAALALARVDDTQAVATLINLLGEVSDRDGRAAIEDMLTELAGALARRSRPATCKLLPCKRDAWLRWWRDMEGPGLLLELKKRTRPDLDPDKVQALVRKMGDSNFEVREQAQKDLIHLGVPVLPLLRQVYRDPPDLEIRLRARAAIETIEENNAKAREEYLPRLLSAARLIALRKPPGAVEAILAYLPSQDEDGLREELESALAAVAFSSGEARPALLKALTDRSGTRRSAAARVLCAVPRPHHLEKARQLLRDPEPAVRLAVAVALADARDPAGLTALASLVAQAPAELALQAEDYLSQLAGEAGPRNCPRARTTAPNAARPGKPGSRMPKPIPPFSVPSPMAASARARRRQHRSRLHAPGPAAA